MSLRHRRSPYRWHVDRFVYERLPRAKALFGLDIGGPSPQCRPYGQSWISINPSPKTGADFHGYAEDLGTFDPKEFDVVQATDMLYLVEDIRKALAETHCVLKVNGVLIATVPFCWPPSGDRDWGRWTAARWAYELKKADFHVDSITPLGGRWTMIEQVLHDAWDWWPPVLCRLDRTMTWPVAYGIVARATARSMSKDGP